MFKSVEGFWHLVCLLDCSFLTNVMKCELRFQLHILPSAVCCPFFICLWCMTKNSSLNHQFWASSICLSAPMNESGMCVRRRFLFTVNKYNRAISQHKYMVTVQITIMVSEFVQGVYCILTLLHMVFPRALFQFKFRFIVIQATC